MKKIINKLLIFPMALLLLSMMILVPSAAAEDLSEVQATAAILVDVSYDTILYEKKSNERLYPASITKVMTALLVVEAVERGDLKQSTVLTASEAALADITGDSSTQNIKVGEEMTVEDLLYCLMVASANEAGNILAEGVSGSVPAFVEAMNARAQELGMTGTQFQNPHGLHRDNHYSTAYDIYLMAREAISHPLFQKVASTAKHEVPATNLSGARSMHNTNALISNWRYTGYLYNPATGIKTGHTPEAGYCLVSSARENGRTLIAVVLGAEAVTMPGGSIDRRQFSESKRMLRWGFSNFEPVSLLDSKALDQEIPVSLGKDVSHVMTHAAESIDAVLPKPYNEELLQKLVSLDQESLTAPVKQGQSLGTITVMYDGVVYGVTDLVAASGVERSLFLYSLDRVKTFFSNPVVWLVALLFFLVIVIRYVLALRRKPRRSNQNRSNTPTSSGRSRR